MSDLFLPPDTAWQRVSPALARLRHRLLLVVAVVLGVVVALLAFLVAGRLLPAVGSGVVVAAVLVGVGWRWVSRVVASWGYAERAEDLYVTHGYLRRRLVVVPYGRMQYVDVQAGPLDRAFGLARVQLHTASASTSAGIPGLPADEAARLRDTLTRLGDTQAVGL